MISFGDGCDLDNCDYLEYLAYDRETQVIGAYLEGAKDGRRLLTLIKEISKTKLISV